MADLFDMVQQILGDMEIDEPNLNEFLLNGLRKIEGRILYFIE